MQTQEYSVTKFGTHNKPYDNTWDSLSTVKDVEIVKVVMNGKSLVFPGEIAHKSPWKQFVSGFDLVPKDNSNDPNAWRSMALDFRVNTNDHNANYASTVKVKMSLSYIMN